MSEPDFADGPWSVGPNHTITSCTPQNIDHKSFKGFDIAEYDGEYLIAESVVCPDTANLISAAPCMYEALKEILDLHEREKKGIREGYNGAVSAKIWVDAFIKAKAALSKAEGKE